MLKFLIIIFVFLLFWLCVHLNTLDLVRKINLYEKEMNDEEMKQQNRIIEAVD